MEWKNPKNLCIFFRLGTGCLCAEFPKNVHSWWWWPLGWHNIFFFRTWRTVLILLFAYLFACSALSVFARLLLASSTRNRNQKKKLCEHSLHFRHTFRATPNDVGIEHEARKNLFIIFSFSSLFWVFHLLYLSWLPTDFCLFICVHVKSLIVSVTLNMNCLHCWHCSQVWRAAFFLSCTTANGVEKVGSTHNTHQKRSTHIDGTSRISLYANNLSC